MPRPRSSRVVWNGTPGEVWKNDTGIVRYQLLCDFHNSCGVCIQYHLAISNWWPIPFHRNCRCRQSPILPNASARPFEDFRDILAGLPHHAQVEAIGASNYRMLDAGLIDWGDVVTPTRVRSLREVVAEKDLTVGLMTGVGVRKDLAEAAYAHVHSPAAEAVRAARSKALKDLEHAGVSREQVYKQVTELIGERVSIGAGPSGPSSLPRPGAPRPTGKLPPDLLAALRHFGHASDLPTPAKVFVPTVEPKQAAPAATPAHTIDVHPEVAGKVNPAMERAARLANEAGFNVTILPASAFNIESAAASYSSGGDVIKINAEHRGWTNVEKYVARVYDTGWLSSDNPDHWINHEIGHGRHFRAIGMTPEKAREFKAALPADLAEKVTKAVSIYASKNKAELVAEVYAGLKAGRKYDHEIMDQFRALGGVEP